MAQATIELLECARAAAIASETQSAKAAASGGVAAPVGGVTGGISREGATTAQFASDAELAGARARLLDACRVVFCASHAESITKADPQAMSLCVRHPPPSGPSVQGTPPAPLVVPASAVVPAPTATEPKKTADPPSRR